MTEGQYLQDGNLTDAKYLYTIEFFENKTSFAELQISNVQVKSTEATIGSALRHR